MSRCLVVLVFTALLGACAADPPRIPPTELGSIDRSVPVESLWSRSLDDAGRGRFEPLVTESAVTVADGDGNVVSYSREQGTTLWSQDLDMRLISGVGGNDDTVFVSGSDGAVIALDATDGTERWRTRASSDVLAPVVLAFDTAIVRSADGRVVRLDLEDGEERWSGSWTPPALTINGYSRPLVVDGGVLVGLDDGRIVALNSSNGRTIWESVLSRPEGSSEVERMVDVDADISVDGDGIYVVNFQGRAARLEPARGSIDWAVPMSSTHAIAIGDDRVIVVDVDGELHALDKSSGSSLWVQSGLRGRFPSVPAVVDGAVVVGDFEGFLHVLDVATGELVGRRDLTDGAIRARPEGNRDSLVVQSREGEIRVLRLAPGGAS